MEYREKPVISGRCKVRHRQSHKIWDALQIGNNADDIRTFCMSGNDRCHLVSTDGLACGKLTVEVQTDYYRQGETGDWLVKYPIGNINIVNKETFERNYTIMTTYKNVNNYYTVCRIYSSNIKKIVELLKNKDYRLDNYKDSITIGFNGSTYDCMYWIVARNNKIEFVSDTLFTNAYKHVVNDQYEKRYEPNVVQAVQVRLKNLNEIIGLLEGHLYYEITYKSLGATLQVSSDMNPPATEGQWIITSSGVSGYRVMDDNAFSNSFERV